MARRRKEKAKARTRGLGSRLGAFSCGFFASHRQQQHHHRPIRPTMTMLCSLELERDHYTLGELLRGYVVLRAETGADLASIIMRVFAYERTYLARVGTLSCDAPARDNDRSILLRD